MKKTACLALLMAAALALGGCAVSAEPAPAEDAPAYPFGEGEVDFEGFTLRVRFVPAGAPLPAAAFAAKM